MATVAAAKPVTADKARVIFFISACSIIGRTKQLVVASVTRMGSATPGSTEGPYTRPTSPRQHANIVPTTPA